jgi:hypothetical protein
MNFLRQIFEEPNGGGSATRAVYVPWFWAITFVHVYISLKTLRLDLEITLTLSFLFLGQKWLQRREEAKKEVVS